MSLNLNRRSFLRITGACSIAAAFAPANILNAAKKRKPNVVLIITDDQGYGDLACHGNTVIKTDAMDKLYSESVRLTDYHVGPTCSPTRAGLMTGRYCNRVGVWHTISGRSQLRKDEVTMADVFSKSGYKTAVFGKWHLGDNYPFRPQDRGFDEVLIHGGGGVGQTPDYWDNDYFGDTYFRNGKPEKHDGYCTEVWFDGAMKFIEDNKNKPFFAYISTNAPHGPFLVDPKYTKMYKDKDNVPNAEFYGMITNIDENIARLREHLEKLDLTDDTILIFTTDNGTAGGYDPAKGKAASIGFNAGMRGKKSSEYDGGHRVPFFMHYPAGGLDKPRDIELLSAHIDIIPTLIEMCDLKKPGKVKYDGMSLAPLIYEQSKRWPDRVIVTDSQRIEDPVKWRKSAVMTNRWRLINGSELYDIKADPSQATDIADKHPDVTERLRGEYEKWWASVSENFDSYTRTIIGSKHQNPVTITCHDWHENQSPWNQKHIRSGGKANGFWAIDVAKSGKYRFQLRRYPVEADLAITAKAPKSGAMPTGKSYYNSSVAIKATSARLKVANFDKIKPIAANAKSVTFDVDLKKGRTQMQTWFTDKETKESRGAFYVYVERL